VVQTMTGTSLRMRSRWIFNRASQPLILGMFKLRVISCGKGASGAPCLQTPVGFVDGGTHFRYQ
jgi:hypothetical protein